MADNVPFGGPYVVATKGDTSDVQHQEVVGEFLTGGQLPVPVSTISPMPTESNIQTELLTAILIELRVQNGMLYALMQTEVEPIETMRAYFKDYPITP